MMTARFLCIFAAACGFLTGAHTGNAGEPGRKVYQSTNWTRDITEGGTLGDYPESPVVPLFVSSIDGHLSASYGYQYIPGKGSSYVRGELTPNGELVPFASYEVATSGTTNWKRIGRFHNPRTVTSVIVDASRPRIVLEADMEPFRPYIGKATWGRLVLENGDNAPVALEDLLPTDFQPGSEGNFKKTIEDEDSRRFGSSFKLVSITRLDNHLFGNFIYIGDPEGSKIKLAGKQTDDSIFWPACIFQAGNVNGEWQTLDSSGRQNGAARMTLSNGPEWQEVRVPLDVYAKTSDQFEYAKIVFDGDRFAVIRSADIALPSRLKIGQTPATTSPSNTLMKAFAYRCFYDAAEATASIQPAAATTSEDWLEKSTQRHTLKKPDGTIVPDFT